MHPNFWKGMLIVCVVMLIVLGFSYPHVEPGSATYVVLHLGALHLLVAMLIIGALLHFDWDPFRAFR